MVGGPIGKHVVQHRTGVGQLIRVHRSPEG
jgi:hypothetical protein